MPHVFTCLLIQSITDTHIRLIFEVTSHSQSSKSSRLIKSSFLDFFGFDLGSGSDWLLSPSELSELLASLELDSDQFYESDC